MAETSFLRKRKSEMRFAACALRRSSMATSSVLYRRFCRLTYPRTPISKLALAARMSSPADGGDVVCTIRMGRDGAGPTAGPTGRAVIESGAMADVGGGGEYIADEGGETRPWPPEKTVGPGSWVTTPEGLCETDFVLPPCMSIKRGRGQVCHGSA